MKREAFLEAIRTGGNLPDQAAAIRVARAVVCSLRDRLDPEEAEGLLDSLRGELPELLDCSRHPHRPPERRRDRLTEPEIADRVRAEAGLRDRTEARAVVRVVTSTLAEHMGGEEPGETANVVRDLGALASRRPGDEEGEED